WAWSSSPGCTRRGAAGTAGGPGSSSWRPGSPVPCGGAAESSATYFPSRGSRSCALQAVVVRERPRPIRPRCFGRLGDRLPLVPTPQTRSLRGGRGARNQRSSHILPGQHGLPRPEPAVANLLCAKTGHNDTSAHKEDLLRWTGNEKGAPGGAPFVQPRTGQKTSASSFSSKA